MNTSANLVLVVRNKDKVLYKGSVFALTSVNDRGIFDVLSGHESFISLIKEKVVIHPTIKTNQEILIDNGILRVYEDKAYVYVNFKS
ncbi:MAG: hypothetical protein HY425_00045 [Candidatus Levybacteria bacterium]|nr:hypothetical protein [Candidatus Levybacteria bacterium]